MYEKDSMISKARAKNKKPRSRKKLHGYNEDFPTDPGMTLNKLPEKIPAKKRTSVPGKQGTGAKEGPAQELPKLLRKSRSQRN